MEDEEQQHSNYEIEMRDGLELRYHIGEPGNWVGVKKQGHEKDVVPGPHQHHEAQGQCTATVWIGLLWLGGGGCHRDCEGEAQGGRPILSSGR